MEKGLLHIKGFNDDVNQMIQNKNQAAILCHILNDEVRRKNVSTCMKAIPGHPLRPDGSDTRREGNNPLAAGINGAYKRTAGGEKQRVQMDDPAK
jgi:hypothetical protein